MDMQYVFFLFNAKKSKEYSYLKAGTCVVNYYLFYTFVSGPSFERMHVFVLAMERTRAES